MESVRRPIAFWFRLSLGERHCLGTSEDVRLAVTNSDLAESLLSNPNSATESQSGIRRFTSVQFLKINCTGTCGVDPLPKRRECCSRESQCSVALRPVKSKWNLWIVFSKFFSRGSDIKWVSGERGVLHGFSTKDERTNRT